MATTFMMLIEIEDKVVISKIVGFRGQNPKKNMGDLTFFLC